MGPGVNFLPAKKPGALLQPGLNLYKNANQGLIRHQHSIHYVDYAIALKHIGNGNG